LLHLLTYLGRLFVFDFVFDFLFLVLLLLPVLKDLPVGDDHPPPPALAHRERLELFVLGLHVLVQLKADVGVEVGRQHEGGRGERGQGRREVGNLGVELVVEERHLGEGGNCGDGRGDEEVEERSKMENRSGCRQCRE
jgi:hypothetical protein